MPTYVMLTNLTSEGVQTLKSNPTRVQEVNKEVEQLGVKVKEQWATLGQYDFVTIVEAPDEKTMAKVSVELGSRGTMSSQTLAAIPSEEPAGPSEGFVVGGGGREHAMVRRCLLARCRSCCARRETRDRGRGAASTSARGS
jgi:uncharacterized protein with GYD domain